MTDRRHDLDALRAVAMLLGIVLHASLAYVPGIPWPVHDARPVPWLGILFTAIHGFRMPLFFLLSGFFTALLWRTRGCSAMLRQRFLRVFVPLLLAQATLVPVFVGLADRGLPVPPENETLPRTEPPLVRAIRAGDAATVAELVAAGADPHAADPEFAMPPITLAALVGDPAVARVLLDAGADPRSRGGDGRTPMHAAAFAGRLAVAELLLARGADAAARSPEGDSPLDSTRVDAGGTAFIAGLLRIQLADAATLDRDRQTIRALLMDRLGPEHVAQMRPTSTDRLTAARNAYRGWLLDPRWSVRLWPGGRPRSLVLEDTFNYLWFLWFLCWFAVGFAAVASLVVRCGLPPCPPGLILSPAALAWIVPATLVPQAFMGLFMPGFGPDTSTSLLPQPHVLAYYAVFFAFGALYQLADDRTARLGRGWPLTLAIGLAACLPLGLATMGDPRWTAVPQVVYAWLMCHAAIGFFRWLVPHESRVWRYLSDSAYWLYLAHLPLVIVIQQWTRDWPIPGLVKFGLVCVGAIAILLISYQCGVRHTPIGRLLNGPGVTRADGRNRSPA